jgi:hypothetical protein
VLFLLPFFVYTSFSKSDLKWEETGFDAKTGIKQGILAFNGAVIDYTRNGKKVLKVNLGEPVVVDVAQKPEKWGFFQFPSIGRIENNLLVVTWSMAADAVTSYGKGGLGIAVSRDGDKTWNPPAAVSVQQPVPKKITIDRFEVEKPDTRHTRFTIAASGDQLKSYSIMMEAWPAGAPVPPGFFPANSFIYLDASTDGKKQVFLFDNGPRDEDKTPGAFTYTFDTNGWGNGRYSILVVAHNRPGPGEYEIERKQLNIDVGAAFVPVVSNIPSARHQVVYAKEGVYAAWPFLFDLGDGRLALSFATKTNDRHVDNTGGAKVMLSSDEGRTWNDSDILLYNLYNKQERRGDGSIVRSGTQGLLYADISQEARLRAEGRHPVRSSDTKIAWIGGPCVRVSSDNGSSWKETLLPIPEALSSSSAYNAPSIRTASGVRLLAVYGRKHLAGQPDKLGQDEVFIVRSPDDGYTWETIPMCPNGLPDPKIGFNETALIEIADGKILALMRSSAEDCLWQTESADAGLTWSIPRQTPMGGFPGNVIRLRDGRLLCAYGMRRHIPQGIRAMLSPDNGKTWDAEHELIIRGDASGNGADFGYPVLYQRTDGSVIVFYYLTTDGGFPSICSTVFFP